MIGIIDTFKKIYSGNNILLKHTILFVLTGLVAMISLPVNELSSVENLSNSQWWTLLLCLIFIFIIGIYTFGYLYNFINASFNRENMDIVPEFDLSHFNTGFKGFLIALCWVLYFVAFAVLGLMFTVLSKLIGTIAFVSVFILGILFMSMQPMLFVDFARERSVKGFLNILQPFKYIKKTLGYVVILLLKLLPIYIFIFLLQAVCFMLPNVLTYIVTAICGYFMFIYNMVLNYQYAQILEEKYYN